MWSLIESHKIASAMAAIQDYKVSLGFVMMYSVVLWPYNEQILVNKSFLKYNIIQSPQKKCARQQKFPRDTPSFDKICILIVHFWVPLCCEIKHVLLQKIWWLFNYMKQAWLNDDILFPTHYAFLCNTSYWNGMFNIILWFGGLYIIADIRCTWL